MFFKGLFVCQAADAQEQHTEVKPSGSWLWHLAVEPLHLRSSGMKCYIQFSSCTVTQARCEIRIEREINWKIGKEEKGERRELCTKRKAWPVPLTQESRETWIDTLVLPQAHSHHETLL